MVFLSFFLFSSLLLLFLPADDLCHDILYALCLIKVTYSTIQLVVVLEYLIEFFSSSLLTKECPSRLQTGTHLKSWSSRKRRTYASYTLHQTTFRLA